MVSFPYSKKRRYLSGIDWVISTLDCLNKSICSLGNHSLIVMELEGQLDRISFQAKLQDFFKSNVVIGGSTKRDCLNLAPYWRKSKNQSYGFSYRELELSDENDFASVLGEYSKFVNEDFSHSHEQISFLLSFNVKSTYLGLKFDHKVLDARGAEALLAYIAKHQLGIEEPFDYPQEPYLRNWKDKFLAGKKINRFLRGLLRGKSINAITVDYTAGEYLHNVDIFDEQESHYILEKANKEAGYLMVLPYLLANVLKEFNSMFFEKSDLDSQFLLPVNMDRRGRNVEKKTLFFNHLSFFYFNLLKSELTDLNIAYAKLREQWYEQMKTKIPESFELSNRLCRIAPMKLLSRALKTQFLKSPAVFSFSYVGEEGFKSDNFMGHIVRDIYHMPIVPYYPGVGLFFTKFKGRLKLVIAAHSSKINLEKIKQLSQNIKERLLVNYGL